MSHVIAISNMRTVEPCGFCEIPTRLIASASNGAVTRICLACRLFLYRETAKSGGRARIDDLTGLCTPDVGDET